MLKSWKGRSLVPDKRDQQDSSDLLGPQPSTINNTTTTTATTTTTTQTATIVYQSASPLIRMTSSPISQFSALQFMLSSAISFDSSISTKTTSTSYPVSRSSSAESTGSASATTNTSSSKSKAHHKTIPINSADDDHINFLEASDIAEQGGTHAAETSERMLESWNCWKQEMMATREGRLGERSIGSAWVERMNAWVASGRD